MDQHDLNDIADRGNEGFDGPPASRPEPDLFGRIGRLVGDIEALKRERQAEKALTARMRMGVVYAKARLEKRTVRG